MAIEVYGAGGANKEAEQKTVTPTTSQQTVTPTDEDHELTQVTVNAMPSGALADITVTAGRITAQVGTAGYLAAGTKKTKDLSRVPAQSYMPGTSDRVIIPANQYTIGSQTLKGDANLVPENIGKGKSIFGVEGAAYITGKYAWTKGPYEIEKKYTPKSVAKTYIGDGKYKPLIVYKDRIFACGYYAGACLSELVNGVWTAEQGSTYVVRFPDSRISYNNSIHFEYNGKLHFVNNTAHFAWDGENWEELPVPNVEDSTALQYTAACVNYNGDIHFICGGTSANNLHYKWDGTNWIKLNGFPISCFCPSAFVYSNYIYAFTSTSSSGKPNLYRFNGSTWELVKTGVNLPTLYNVAGYKGMACEFFGDIYIVAQSGTSTYIYVYVFNGIDDFTLLSTTSDYSVSTYEGISLGVCNNELYGLCGITSSTQVSKGTIIVMTANMKYQDAPDIVLSDNENEYPEDGIVDGLYYKKVIVGGSNAKYAVGSFTIASGSYLDLPHNLGFIPNWFFAETVTGGSSSYSICASYNKSINSKAYVRRSTYRYDVNAEITETEITIPRYSSYSWTTGATCFWACGE